MSFDKNVSVMFHNYKSFGDDFQGFETIAPINIIIGRNNSGKSALLDIVDYMTHPRDVTQYGHVGKTPEVRFSAPLDDASIRSVFSDSTSGGPIPGNHYLYGKKWIGKIIHVSLAPDNNKSFVSIEPEVQYADNLARRVDNPFKNYTFKRILAERDIKPEQESALVLEPDGTGVTNLIQHFLYDSLADQSAVEVELLGALNRIFEPDSTFTRIQAKRLSGTNKYEIYLEEEHKGSIALSNSGSGLKTVMTVLAQALLIPKLENKDLNSYIFGLEELENNLHPGLQRRLFGYLRELAIGQGVTVFITTHSNVVIDLFSTDEQAQILHVTHDGKSARVKTLTSYGDGSGILDDLDIRASDLLQSNGIIWVEGPSDRTYINRYVELISDGALREGAQYQIMFYGGRLLARVSADPKNNEQANLLKVNRHSALVIDSDKRAVGKKINATKARMKKEVEAVKGYVWITDGKEIENAIPVDALRSLYKQPKLKHVGQLDAFEDYLKHISATESKEYLRSKVQYAEKVVPEITRTMIASDAKLLDHIKQICRRIENWNRG